MGCSSCGGGIVPITARPVINGNNITLPCLNYNYEKLTSFYSKLKTVKDSGDYILVNTPLKTIVSYLGYVQSALNYPENYCFFQEKLDEISQVILLIDAL